MVDATTFAVPENSLEHWMTRLAEHAVEFDGPFERFSHQIIAFRDPNGLALELAALGAPSAADAPNAIQGFDAVTLCVEAPERTARLLTETFGYRQVAEGSGHIRFRAAGEAETAIGLRSTCSASPKLSATSEAAAPSTTSRSARSDRAKDLARTNPFTRIQRDAGSRSPIFSFDIFSRTRRHPVQDCDRPTRLYGRRGGRSSRHIAQAAAVA